MEVSQAAHRVYRAPWSVGPRALSENLVWFVGAGGCAGEVEGEAVRLEAGDLMWLAPGVKNAFEVRETMLPWDVYNVRFRLDEDEAAPNVPLIVVRGAWELRSWMEAVVDEMRVPSVYHRTNLRALLMLLCGAFSRGSRRRNARRKD